MSVNKKSFTWEYFEKSRTTDIATCLICKKEYRTCGNTSNLINHLKRSHQEIMTKEKDDKEDPNTSDSQSKRFKSQPRLDNFVKVASYKNCSTRKKEIDEQVALMVATDLQPYSFVEDTGFRKLMNIMDPRYVVPSRKTIKNLLNGEIFDKTFNKLMEILSEVKYVSLTTDLWTSSANTESYCTITCHFIYKDKNESAVLDTSELQGRHTAQNIKEHITNSINEVIEFKDIVSKVGEIVTFFKRSNVAMNILREEQKKRCVPELKLLKDIVTRWNSILIMLQRILEIGDCIVLALTKCANAPAALNLNEINIIKEAVTILSIFQFATEQISGDKYPTASLIIPISLGIHKQLTEIGIGIETQVCKTLVEALKVSIVKRLFPYESRNSVQLAALLDPRVKKLGFRLQENANEGHESLKREVVRIINSGSHAAAESFEAAPMAKVEVEESSNKSPTVTSQSIFSFLKERTEKAILINPLSESIILVRQYLEIPPVNMAADILKYWKTSPYKYLDTLALKYLCIPATSVPSERVFSQAGIIISTKRSRLKSKNVNKMIFVNKNQKFLSF
ncbi:zinc finger BED domain-containing protein 1-like isoform X2 [Sitophilus oryzae]|uniref:Zinc finger BED domain-containing protein 1-like isoform X2 n=1 Tax=Sitophilus oryzae TaxID=7048 RepID=A0A6J2XJU3_SITOR|nr:zinc finger BED domain-containing protein 1-like isoform X2 [Sitophilus oryzae]